MRSSRPHVWRYVIRAALVVGGLVVGAALYPLAEHAVHTIWPTVSKIPQDVGPLIDKARGR
jgi:hypothetical protein